MPETMPLESASLEAGYVAAACAGDLAAFGRLVQLHQGAIRAFLSVRVSSPHDAEDLAQETFLIAHRRLEQFEAGRAFGPWLRGIAQNLLWNHRRKHRPDAVGHLAELDALVADAIEDQQAGGREEDFLTATRHCLGELDAESRDLLRARYEEEQPLADLCQRFVRKHSAMTMWLHRIRLSVRRCIEKQLAGA